MSATALMADIEASLAPHGFSQCSQDMTDLYGPYTMNLNKKGIQLTNSASADIILMKPHKKRYNGSPLALPLFYIKYYSNLLLPAQGILITWVSMFNQITSLSLKPKFNNINPI